MKTSGTVLLTCICVLWIATGADAGVPGLVDAGRVQLESGPFLDVGSFSAPTMVDWNNDSAMDLVVGQMSSGKIRLYLNSGTNEDPAFDTYAYIKANGVDITAPYC